MKIKHADHIKMLCIKDFMMEDKSVGFKAGVTYSFAYTNTRDWRCPADAAGDVHFMSARDFKSSHWQQVLPGQVVSFTYDELCVLRILVGTCGRNEWEHALKNTLSYDYIKEPAIKLFENHRLPGCNSAMMDLFQKLEKVVGG